jgi:hypothetical protein
MQSTIPDNVDSHATAYASSVVCLEKKADTVGGSNQPGAVKRTLAGTTAVGWYLSLALHSAGYIAATATFAWLGFALLPDDPVPAMPEIRASLAEESILDDLPALEIRQAPGPDNDGAEDSLEQLASQLAISDRGEIDTVVNDAKIAVMGSTEAEPVDQGDTQFFRVPESGLAVTRGSFTAWTDPAQPRPGDFYQIIIEMRLPDRLNRYRLTDLSGRVVGTDGYSQRLPFDARKANAARVTGGAEPKTVKRNTVVELIGNKLQLAIKVPGARRLVKDTIYIKSRRLREEQEITLVFGGAATSVDSPNAQKSD